MKSNKFIAVLFITASWVSMQTLAADMQNTDSHKEKVVAEATQPMSTGEVKKIDKEQGKITIKHGELNNLGMPPMTMVFHVKDVAMLDTLKAGQTIKFIAENVNGALTVVKIN